LDEAYAAFECAARELDAKIERAREIGLTQPDGAHMMKNGASGYRHALEEYHVSLKRFADFILYGAPPK
jgi:hypothetical protein